MVDCFFITNLDSDDSQIKTPLLIRTQLLGALRVITGKYAFVDLPRISDIQTDDTLMLTSNLFDRNEVPLTDADVAKFDDLVVDIIT